MSSPDIRQLEKQLLTRAKKERRSGPKPVRLSNLLAQTAWLGGEILWRDGRVVFQVGEKTVQIEEADLTRTSRALELLATRDLRRELADTIAERRRKFQYLREIATLEAPDLKTLCSLSRRQNPKAIERLGALLVVESLVPELLDSSPTRALALAWPLSQPVLEALAKSEVYPESTRELAHFALVNRHFEFWQKNNDFPVALCVKLGFSGHGIPHPLEKSGPYSLSYSQIFELYQQGHSKEKILSTVEALRNLPSIWLNSNNLELPPPYKKNDFKDNLEARIRYKNFAKASQEAITETLLNLVTKDLKGALTAAKFLNFWQWRWHDSFSAVRKRRHIVAAIDSADDVYNAAFSIVKSLEHHAEASEILEFTIEKLREAVGSETPPHCLHYLKEELHRFCEAARFIGVQRTRQLTDSDLWTLKPLYSHPEWLELAFEWSSFCDGSTEFFGELEQTQKKGSQVSLIRSFGYEIQKELRCFTPANRAVVLEHALAENWSRAYSQILVELYRKYTPEILKFKIENHQTWADILPVFACVASQQKWSLETALSVLKVTFEVFKGHFDWSKEQGDCYDAIRTARHLTVLFNFENKHDIDGYRVALGKAFEWLKSSSSLDFLWHIERNAVVTMAHRKKLRRAFLAVARRTPRFLFDTIPRLDSLKRLHLMDVFDTFESRIPLQGEQWHRFLARYPALEPEIRDCFTYSQLAGEELTAPPISNRWRDYETKTPREMEFLRAKILQQPQNLGLQKRLATLEEQWQTRDVWLQNELRECLLDATSNSAKVAIQNAISSALRVRLRFVCGELPPNLELDNDWVNAILLACEVEENRKWAVAILRNCARELVEPSNVNWRENLEGNKPFLEELRSRGKNLDVYGARNERQIGEYTLWIESEPLQILQMGNRFDTCLSRGGINEHSAITNVIDANKKVVYARHFSSIVGRQLLCVSEKFELLGYYVYSTFPSESKEKYALNLAFDEYASLFAEGVGIEKADEGEVPPLCGASWYNDYEIKWETLREEPPQPDTRSKSRSRSSKTTRLSTETTQSNHKANSPIRQTRQNDSSDSRLGISTLSPT